MNERRSKTLMLAGLIVGLVVAFSAADAFTTSFAFRSGPAGAERLSRYRNVAVFGRIIWKRELSDETMRQGWIVYAAMLACFSLAGAGIGVAAGIMPSSVLVTWRQEARLLAGLVGLIVGFLVAVNTVNIIESMDFDFGPTPIENPPDPPAYVRVSVFGGTVYKRVRSDDTVRSAMIFARVIAACVSLTGAVVGVAMANAVLKYRAKPQNS